MYHILLILAHFVPMKPNIFGFTNSLYNVNCMRREVNFVKISSRGRYALRIMIDIAENSAAGRVTIKDISERQDISVKYLEQIVTHLKRAKLLRSERGSHGGYMLTKKLEDYTAGEIIRAIEGDLAPVSCLADENNYCERKDFCPTLVFWKELYKMIDKYVDSITLENLITFGK